MKVRVLMVTHNRPDYVRLSLSRLLDTLSRDMRLTIWDNASCTETVEILKAFQGHPLVEKVILNKSNDRLWGPTNWFWQNAGDAEFLSKVDDDGLMPDNWTETLMKAHYDIPEAGILGTWRFMQEDFDENLAKIKIQSINSHQVLRNCWVEGSGYLMKRKVISKIGILRKQESFTTYCIRAASKGFLNGWYYPFLFQEHMDDPRAPHSGIQNEADFHRLKPLSAETFGIKTRSDWIALNKNIARRVQMCSFDPRHYIGIQAKVFNRVFRLLGRDYNPQA